MRPTALVVAACAACSLLPVASTSAREESAAVHSSRAKCRDADLRRKYVVKYHHVARVFGANAPGNDIHRTRGCRQVARSIRTYRRWLNEPGAWASPRDRTPTSHRTSPRTTGGLYAIPAYIVWRESRGSYTVYNRGGSGAYGAYQLMPFHWSRGVCKGLGRDPAGQDACAARLWADGSHHWSATR